MPLPQFNRSSWVTGVTYKPNADVAIKFDYVFNRNASTVVRAGQRNQSWNWMVVLMKLILMLADLLARSRAGRARSASRTA